jgi:hypothetical protein
MTEPTESTRVLVVNYIQEHDALRALADAVGAFVAAYDASDVTAIEEGIEAMRVLLANARKARAT